MERLTFEGNFCEIAQCECIKCPHDTDCSQKQVWERLKQYEDTGLSPIACEESVKIEKGLSEGGYSISHMVELMCADQEGRVVVLPCKRGDELWTHGIFPSGGEVYKVVVSDVSTLNGRTVLNTYGFGTIRSEDIGKTVFLAREEAEKALAEMEGKKDG